MERVMRRAQHLLAGRAQGNQPPGGRSTESLKVSGYTDPYWPLWRKAASGSNWYITPSPRDWLLRQSSLPSKRTTLDGGVGGGWPTQLEPPCLEN